ncbi:MAG: hypothetical protein NTV80_02540 [Verrucomicrobia bacterium]|nr:hypothetical protein [Verrucomicrobiota bacterium]
MNYPLSFRFKLLALSPQIYIQDSTGKSVCYVKQKLFRLKEKVEVFSDDTQQNLISTISADRILDWSARYTFRDAAGNELGAVGRRGMRSLWSAHYDIFSPGSTTPAFSIREENPMAKLLDTFLGQIPIIGMFTGFFFHPRFLTTRADGSPIMRLTKQSALFEGKFQLDQITPVTEGEETAIILAYLMMNLLERSRG